MEVGQLGKSVLEFREKMMVGKDGKEQIESSRYIL